MLVQHGFHGIQLDLESGHIRGNHFKNEAGLLGKGLVFGEVGGHSQDLTAGHRQGTEHSHQLRSSAAHDEEIFRGCTGVVTCIQVIGNGAAHGQVTHGGGIAMDSQRIRIGKHLADGLVHLFGRGNGGIAQGIVVDIFTAYDGSALAAVFKQVPDAGTVGTQGVGFFVDHRYRLLYRYSGCLGL